MMKKYIVLTIFTLITSTVFVFAQSRSMAVMPFDIVGNAITADEAEAITELYIAELVDAGVVKIVDRANFDKVMKEINFQSSDWSNSEKTAKLGKALNAKFISRGKIMKLGSKLTISVSVIDIQTAENVAATKATYEDIDELVSKLYKLEITSLAKDVFYSKGPAGGTVFHFDGKYFYEVAFLTEKYSWNDCKDRNYDFEFGGYSDWRFPNAIEAKYIFDNLLKGRNKNEIEGDYWIWEYCKYVQYKIDRHSYWTDYYCSTYADKADNRHGICLVRKFTDE